MERYQISNILVKSVVLQTFLSFWGSRFVRFDVESLNGRNIVFDNGVHGLIEVVVLVPSNLDHCHCVM